MLTSRFFKCIPDSPLRNKLWKQKSTKKIFKSKSTELRSRLKAYEGIRNTSRHSYETKVTPDTDSKLI